MIQKLEFLRGLKGLLSLSPPGKGNLKRPGVKCGTTDTLVKQPDILGKMAAYI
jgi:hypothetical protein